MAERLGHVLYLAGSIIAVLAAGFAGYVWHYSTNPDWPIFTGFFAAVAALAWGLGWACRYVLAGR